MPKSAFLQVMQERGFINACTDLESLDEQFCKHIVTAYIGFDATACSLHVGSLVQIMMLRWLQKTGHRPIVLMGGGTTKIGDPSFRNTARPQLYDEEIVYNVWRIKRVFNNYLTFGDGDTDALLLNNDDWLNDINYISWLRDVGKYFTVNRMLTFEAVKSRLAHQEPMTFFELNYMLLQAYDFLHLNSIYRCQLQMGGSDQWGNIVSGIDLIRRVSERQAYGLTSPLLTLSNGDKMGKTKDGAVWLDADSVSPYSFWQYWRNIPDEDVGRFLLLFTELDYYDCIRMGRLQGSEANVAKIALANEVTGLLHGKEAAEEAEHAISAVDG